mmetsp:Transcript_49523/g.55182  ORF Transcript_49523/g.55182 Transcript_49523/m.55182 type:complete len:102 (+) Transcript_49523:400-705(+)
MTLLLPQTSYWPSFLSIQLRQQLLSPLASLQREEEQEIKNPTTNPTTTIIVVENIEHDGMLLELLSCQDCDDNDNGNKSSEIDAVAKLESKIETFVCWFHK